MNPNNRESELRPRPTLQIYASIDDVRMPLAAVPAFAQRAERLGCDGLVVPEAVYDAIPLATRGPGVHVMTGPIHVEGAQAGDTLEVRVLSMEPRLPYGTKSAGTVHAFTHQCLNFLMGLKPKLLVVACNTASALALEKLKGDFDVPVIGVLEPGAQAAVLAAKKKRGATGRQHGAKAHVRREGLEGRRLLRFGIVHRNQVLDLLVAVDAGGTKTAA